MVRQVDLSALPGDLTHGVIEFLPANVECEPSHFAAHFAILGFVPVVLGAGGREVDDVVTSF